LLPKEYPKWQIVYYYFARWRESEWFIALNDQLRQKVRRSVWQANRDKRGNY